MRRTDLARLLTAPVLLLFTATAALPPVASATALPSGATYQQTSPEPMVEPFTPPGAPGETAPITGTAATESREPVEGAVGETGVETELPPQDLGPQ